MPAIHYSRQIPVSFTTVSDLLLSEPSELLDPSERGLWAEVAGVEIAHPVELALGEVTMVDGPVRVIAVPFEINGTDHARMFPVLRGELEVTPIGTNVEVALEGEYDAPAGPLGWLADRVAFHLFAEKSLERYFRLVLQRIRDRSQALDALTGVPV